MIVIIIIIIIIITSSEVTVRLGMCQFLYFPCLWSGTLKSKITL